MGCDVMDKWDVQISIKQKRVILHIQSKTISISCQPNINSCSSSSINSTSTPPVQLQQVLKRYDHLMLNKNQKPTVTHLIEFEIDTGDNDPIYTAPRRFHPEVQRQIDEKLEELVRSGVARKVTFSRWGSPVTAISKPDKTLRIYGSYIKLNSITKTIKYPFTNLHQVLLLCR
jgi:hypothetical protein